MVNFWRHGLSPAALILAVSSALAQPAAQAGKADPLDPEADVPVLAHVSAFAGYRSPGGSAPLSWREANETVNRIGGWRTYAREASRPDAAPAAPPAAAAPAHTVPGHGGHPAN